MLRIRGNKEFVQWWEHWMSRIHANRRAPQTKPTDRPSKESGREERENTQDEIKSTVQSTRNGAFFKDPEARLTRSIQR
jgi:hypothetical protein